MIAVAALCFSVMSVLVKQAGKELPVEMLVLARGVVTLVISYLLVRRRGLSPWGHDKPRLLLRGLLGLGGLGSFFYAITSLPLADVTVIHYLNPVITALLAGLLLREAIGIRLLLALSMGMCGVVLVARPSWLFGVASNLSPLGIGAALSGAVFSACAYVTVRRLTRTDDPLVIVFYFPLVAVPATLPFAVMAWRSPSALGWLLMLGIGVVTQIAQVLLTKGLALLPAGRGTTIGYIQIVFASMWGALLFGEPITLQTAAGALLVLAAAVVLLGRPSAARPRQAR